MSAETFPFDAAEFIDTEETQAELLADAFASGDPAYIANALGVVARARGMTDIARAAGVTREALYKALSAQGDPRLSTLLGVVKALGFSLSANPAPLLEDAKVKESPQASKPAGRERASKQTKAKPKRLNAA